MFVWVIVYVVKFFGVLREVFGVRVGDFFEIVKYKNRYNFYGRVF